MATPTPVAIPSQGSSTQKPASPTRAPQASSLQQELDFHGSSHIRSPKTPDVVLPAQANPVSMQDQLDKVQTFCVYASELIDTQREDINRVSAAVERIEFELRSLKELLGEMKGELQTIPREKKSNGVGTEEIDLLTSSMGEIGRKANEIDTLKLELAMMKGKVKRLEDALQLQPPTNLQHSVTTDPKLPRASVPHTALSFGGRSQSNNQSTPVQGARPATEASAAKIREADEPERSGRGSMPKGKKRRHGSPSEEVAASHYDGYRRRTLDRLVEPSHSSPFSFRHKRPEQIRPHRAAAATLGEDKDSDYLSDYALPSSQSSSSHTDGGGVRSGQASVRGHARPSRRSRVRPLDHMQAHLREQDELGMNQPNGHRVSSGGAINGISGVASFHAKHEEKTSRHTRSKAPTQAPNQMKESSELAKSGKIGIGMGVRYTRPGKRKDGNQFPPGDQRDASDHDDMIKARERALDDEWAREYGLGS